MKFSRIIPLLALMVLALSCSKEESVERKKETGNNGSLLVKVTMQSPGTNYTIVTTLEYDDNKKLIKTKQSIDGKVNAAYGIEEDIFHRDNNGMIKQIIAEVKIYDDEDAFQGKYTQTMNLFLSSADRYKYGIRTLTMDTDDPITDSIAYTYNDKGRIVLVNIFRKDIGSSTYERDQVTGYNYDAKGNLSTMAIQFDVNDQDPPQVLNFEYNDKFSPMNFGDEALLNGFIMEGLSSPYCLTGVSDLTEPDNTWTISYEYNELNKPVKGVYKNPVTDEKINYSYFYE